MAQQFRASVDSATLARVQLLRELRSEGYRFVTPTPATHERVLRREGRMARGLRDIFGWNRPFAREALPSRLWDLLLAAGHLESDPGGYRTRVRVASLDDLLFLHSGFPTDDVDAVFFGPDSYRFAAFVSRRLQDPPARRIIDMGAGAGIGGVIAAKLQPTAKVALVDINPRAVELGLANGAANDVNVSVRCQGDLAGMTADVVIANPPYLLDPAGRTYRNGGGQTGEGVSVAWAQSAADVLGPGGIMLLYTGAAVVDGRLPLVEALSRLDAFDMTCREADPDVFGEELLRPGYETVERIAAVEVVLRRR